MQILGLNEVYTGGVGSYALFLMIIAFLQQKKERNLAHPSLGSLLINFFCYFGIEFPYTTKGISVRNEGSLFTKEERGWLDSNQPHMLSIEDPNNPENVSLLSF